MADKKSKGNKKSKKSKRSKKKYGGVLKNIDKNVVKDILVACSTFKKNVREPSLYASSINHNYSTQSNNIISLLEHFINENVDIVDDSNIFVKNIKNKNIKNIYNILDLHYGNNKLYYNLIAVDPSTTRLNYIDDSSPLVSDFKEFTKDLDSTIKNRIVIDTDNYIDNYDTLLSYIEKNPTKKFDVIYFSGCWFNHSGLGSLFDLGTDTLHPKSNYYDPKHGDCNRILNILKTMFSNLKSGGLFIIHAALLRKEYQMQMLNFHTGYNPGIGMEDIPVFMMDIIYLIDKTIAMFKRNEEDVRVGRTHTKLTDDYNNATECLNEIRKYFMEIFTDGTFVPLIDINIPIYTKL